MTEIAPPPVSISRVQFFWAAAVSGLLTEAEAKAAVQIGAIPALMQSAIDALPQDQQFAVTMLVCGNPRFERWSAFTIAIAAAAGMSGAQTDDLFRLGVTLG